MARQLGKIAKRYAAAMFSAVTKESGVVGGPESIESLSAAQQAAAALSRFARLWQTEPELSSAVINPMFDKQHRLKALLRLAADCGLQKILLRSLEVIFEHDRILALPEIAEAFSQLADKAAGIVEVEVSLAREISPQDAMEIENKLNHAIPGVLRLSWRLDSKILGGMIIKYQGKVVDGSLNSRLEEIEKILRG